MQQMQLFGGLSSSSSSSASSSSENLQISSSEQWVNSFEDNYDSHLYSPTVEQQWQTAFDCIKSDYENHVIWDQSVLDRLGDCVKRLANQQTNKVKNCNSKIIELVCQIITHLENTGKISQNRINLIHNPHWNWIEKNKISLPDYWLPAKKERELGNRDLHKMISQAVRLGKGYIYVFVKGSDNNPGVIHKISLNMLNELLELRNHSDMKRILIQCIYNPVILKLGTENVIATLDLIMKSGTIYSLLQGLENTLTDGKLDPIPLDKGGFSMENLEWINDHIYTSIASADIYGNVFEMIKAADYLNLKGLREAVIDLLTALISHSLHAQPNIGPEPELSSILNTVKRVRESGFPLETSNEILTHPEVQKWINQLFMLYLKKYSSESQKAFFNRLCGALLLMHNNRVNITALPNECIRKAFEADLILATKAESSLNAIQRFCINLSVVGFSQDDIGKILNYPILRKLIGNCFHRCLNSDIFTVYEKNIKSVWNSILTLRTKLSSEGLSEQAIDTILGYPILQEKIDGALSRYLRLNGNNLVPVLSEAIQQLAVQRIPIKSIGFDIDSTGSHEEKKAQFIECLKLLHKHLPNLEKISLVGCYNFKHQPEYEPLIMKFKELKGFRFVLDYVKHCPLPSDEFEDFLISQNGYGFDVALRDFEDCFTKESIDMIDSDTFWYRPQSVVGKDGMYWRKMAIKY